MKKGIKTQRGVPNNAIEAYILVAPKKPVRQISVVSNERSDTVGGHSLASCRLCRGLKGAKHARHALRWQKRCRTQKWTSKGALLCSACIKGEGKVSNTKTTHNGWFSCSTCIAVVEQGETHQQGCIFMFGVHCGGKKGVECKYTPIVGGFHARCTETKDEVGGCTMTNVSVEI